MPNKITETAQMQCDKGSSPASLNVTSHSFMEFDGKLIATEGDNGGGSNIPSFGACALKKGGCSPAPTVWNNTSPYGDINDQKLLTTDSQCPCSVGGNIKFISDGHGGNLSSE